MFNTNRVLLAMFATLVCMQIAHGTHYYRKNKKLLPKGTVIAEIKAAQATMYEPSNPKQVTRSLDTSYSISQEANEECRSKMADNIVGCCVFTAFAACTLLTAASSL